LVVGGWWLVVGSCHQITKKTIAQPA